MSDDERAAARAMLAALKADNERLAIADRLCGLSAGDRERLARNAAAIAQAEAAGIKAEPDFAPETRHARDCAYVTASGPAPCTCTAIAAGIKAED